MHNLVNEEAKSKRESLNARLRSARPDRREPALSEVEGRLPYVATASATTRANSLTSSSVVSNEHIQRTMDSSSIHM